MTKFCVDCKHHEKRPQHHWCVNPKLGTKLNAVTGVEQRLIQQCTVCREAYDECHFGNWFEQKPKLTLWQKVKAWLLQYTVY